jgi:hypothetical protein
VYEEFSREERVMNVVVTGSIDKSWVNVFTDLTNKQPDVLNIPGSNARNETVLLLMSNKWTEQRNQSSLELIKSELMVAVNY